MNAPWQQTIGFDAEDLQRNRAGQLGAGQAARMWRRVGGLSLVALAVLVVDLILAAGTAVSGLLPLLCVAAVGVAGAAGVGWSAVRLALDAAGGQVAQVAGPVQPTAVHGRHGTTHYFGFGGQRFTVSPQTYRAVAAGQHLRVYYTPRSKRLVALEAVGQ